MSETSKTLEWFRSQATRMSARDMLLGGNAQDLLVNYTDENWDFLSSEDSKRQFLIYPGELGIEIVGHAPDTPDNAPRYHLQIGNFEMLGQTDELPQMERELYEFGLSEGMFE